MQTLRCLRGAPVREVQSRLDAPAPRGTLGHMMRRTWWLGLSLVALPACGSEASSVGRPDQAAPIDASSRRVCANCVPPDVAATEPSETPDSGPCALEPAPVPDDAQWNARIAEVRAAYDGPFDATLRWDDIGRVEPESPDAFWTARPSGYEPVTRVTGNIRLGPARFFPGRSTSSNVDGFDCPDRFEIPATIDLATSDGALAGTAHGSFSVGSGPSRLSARIDLAEALGTLDLHLDPSLEYDGLALLSFNFHPEGKRGNIAISVVRSDVPLYGYFPLDANFPDDGCGESGFATTSDAPLSWLDGQTAAQALASWDAALQSQPFDGRRHDCTPDAVTETPVEVSFEFGAIEPALCELPAWTAGGAEGGFSFRGEVRLRTSDGRIDVPLISGSATQNQLTLISDEALTPLSSTSELIPSARFAEQSGIQGVHPGNSAELGYFVAAHFLRTGSSVMSNGSLSVEGIDCTSQPECVTSNHADVFWPLNTLTYCPL
jgi:hypothetical protein